MDNTFGINIIPDNEQQRIAALKRYKILDTPPEHAFDNVARLATQIFKVPISLVSLVDAEQVFFKANIGMGKARVTSRGISLCSLAILKPEVTVFENAPEEPCLLINPNVAGEFGLKFYAGAPLTTHDGLRIGTLCVIDKTPRKFSKADELILEGLAKIVMDEIELRLSAITETDKLRDFNEELATTNEELNSTIEELAVSRKHLDTIFEQLSGSEAKLRIIFEQAPAGIAILKGRDLIIESVNDQILEIWGERENITNLPLSVGVPRLKGTPYLKIMEDVYLTGKTYYGYDAKVEVVRDGKLKDTFYNFAYRPLKDDTGHTHSIMVVATDITEQMDARKVVDDSNERLAMAMDAGSLGSYDLDIHSGLLYCSEQCKKNYGLEKDAVFNYPDLLNLMLPEYREYVNKQINTAVQNNSFFQAEYQVLWPDGSRHWINAFGKPKHDYEGKVNRLIGVTQNITERKEFERRKDDFLSVASHELKTPITSLKANLQLLERIKEDLANPMLPRLIDSAIRSMDKINSLVDDLLNMHRYSEGQLRLNKKVFNTREMLNYCCNHVRVAGKHELIVESDEEIQLYADEHRIDQVVVNFVNNAVKYAPNSKQIYLIVSREGGFVKISVKDFGPGIPTDQLPHLFDRYWRADHSGAKYTGLGLGLYICSEIIKRHNGQIGVHSEPGIGSTFWFTVPLINTEQE